jgi:hypothetical protein
MDGTDWAIKISLSYIEIRLPPIANDRAEKSRLTKEKELFLFCEQTTKGVNKNIRNNLVFINLIFLA